MPASPETLQTLEFGKIRLLLEHTCYSKEAKTLARELTPLKDKEIIEFLLRQTYELFQVITANGYFPNSEFPEFKKEAHFLNLEGSVLSEKQLLNLKQGIEDGNTLIRYLKEKKAMMPLIASMADDLNENRAAAEIIDSVLDAEGLVKSSASHELLKIRKTISEKRREADRKFYNYVNEIRKLGYLRENEESVFNGRRTLAVMADNKSQVAGFVHGKSESGKTVFIEPSVTIQLNNDVTELENDEHREIIRILRELSEKLRPFANDFIQYYDLLVKTDFIKAKAKLGVMLKAELPELRDEAGFHLKNAFHPLLYLQNIQQKKTTVPLNIQLGKPNRVLVISGPNAGGKSVSIKTVGLLQLMVQSGLLIPAAAGSGMGVCKHIMIDLGDTQSIENELSTYSARLKNMKQILEDASENSLILLDEFGGGTDPELGGALAEIILESLLQSKTIGIITTHYSNIKVLTSKLKGAVNGSMLFDINSMEPLYKLSIGQPGSSFTFEVAERVGFPKDLIEQAKKRIDADKLKLNRLIAEVENQKYGLNEAIARNEAEEKKRREAKEKYINLFEEWRVRQENEREKKMELARLATYGQRYLRLLNDWQDKEKRKLVVKRFIDSLTAESKKRIEVEKEKFSEANKQKNIDRIKPFLQAGSKVKIMNSSGYGIVESLDDNTASVNFGNMKMKVGLENLVIYREPVK
jgi:DNA mismatch repair protein MutS2